jgi:ATP adenylyltransferase
MTYIKGEVEEDGCLFCTRLEPEDGPNNLVLHRGERAYVILNRYPYTNGHVMVVPFEHQPSIEDLNQETQAELMELTGQALRALREQYGAQNFNIGINIGEAAGAGVVDHVHIHIVPRWSGDTNFMTTTARTRVLPESLEETFECLRSFWRDIPSENR